MPEDKREAERLGGEHMIHDRDHTTDIGQMGGESRRGGARQSEQSQSGSRQQGSGQQGGEKRRRTKFL